MPCKKGKTCKRMCVWCKHIRTNNSGIYRIYECAASENSRVDCVTGEKCSYLELCKNVNKNGNCDKFEMDKEKQAKRILLNAIEKFYAKTYRAGRYNCYPYDPSAGTEIKISAVEAVLIQNLMESLKDGKASEFMEVKYYDGYDTEYYVIYKEDFRIKHVEYYKKWRIDNEDDAND